MIKMMNREMLEVLDGLRAIGNEVLPIKAAYWVAKITKKMVSEFSDYEAQRKAIIEKYAEKDEKGSMLMENNKPRFGANKNQAEEDYQKLLDIVIEIDVNPMKIIDFDFKNIQPNKIIPLLGTVIEDEAEDK